MRYRVVETVQFSDLWQYAVDAGIVDAVEETRLHGLANLLALDPYRFTLFRKYWRAIGLAMGRFHHWLQCQSPNLVLRRRR